MVQSTFRRDANRLNAAKSTGPKTAEGKARSRGNAYKHGLTGAGIALPKEEAAEVQGRFEALEAEIKPNSELARILVQRVALFSIRMERCARHETVQLSRQIRAAEGEFVEARKREVDRMFDRLASEPAAMLRGLKRTPEGIERLIGGWLELRGNLVRKEGGYWSSYHSDRAENLSGRPVTDYHVTRYRALDRGLSDDPSWLDAEDLKYGDLKSHCLAELTRMIDDELANLRQEFAAIDRTDLDRDRAEAADRALFDPSQEATLVRRYEAAAERGMYKALDRIEMIRDQIFEEGLPGDEADPPELASEPEIEATKMPEGSPRYPNRMSASFFPETTRRVVIELSEAEKVAKAIADSYDPETDSYRACPYPVPRD